MPFFKINIDRDIEQCGEVTVWAPHRQYLWDNRREVLDVATEFAEFEHCDGHDSLRGVTEVGGKIEDIDEELRFGYVEPEEEEEEKVKDIVLPGQLRLLEV